MKPMKTILLVCLAILAFALGGCQKRPAPTPPEQLPAIPLRVEEGLTPQAVYNALVGRLGLVGSVLENEGTGPVFQEAQMYTVRVDQSSAPALYIFAFTDASQAQKALEGFLGQDLTGSGFDQTKIYQKDNLLAIYTGSSNEASEVLAGMMDIAQV
ncbi:hypothetical protein [Zongyangia hominis]|uniref:DUF4825 domain-containing protein n=1 Tax=Zongyangia hominis TaxID=2763677 RepID=A0A926EF55_9FIRM|nr:hypothetical protein [Zongyangia hominis]MBC8570567.1 hypothetical protein [Zongyangia hominis]